MSSSKAIRTMASLLYEYAIPGLRRTKMETQKGIILKRTKGGTKIVVDRFEKAYNSPEFNDYLQYCIDNPNKKAVNREEQPTVTEILERNNSIMPSPRDIEFYDLIGDIKMSYQIFEFMQKGVSSMLMGNPRRRFVSYIWIFSTDQERKDCLLNVDAADTLLNSATKVAFGEGYNLRIHKRLGYINFLCEESIKLQKSKSGPAKKMYNKLHKSLTLQYDQAKYLKNLYDLDAWKRERK